MVLGHQQVQGVDYAYTLQGWLKGMNSTGGSIAHDMGGDGKTGDANQYTARDALGLTLNYFGSDYSSINAGTNPFPAYSAYLNTSYKPLYNGNISSSSVFNRKLAGQLGGDMLFYNYRYDQLNRITGMDVYNGFSIAGNNWNAMQAATVNTVDSVMREKVAYDANGNISSYRRNHAGGLLMDNLQYKYYPGTNQLRQVTDGVTNDGQFGSDIDHQTDISNYVYDAIGNLVQDKKEQITGIKWNVYGKITEITRNSTGTVPVTNIKYVYDALGNRIGKIFDLGNQKRYTWYVRDAQGNILSIYEANDHPDTSLAGLQPSQAEQYFYGSSRLGFLGNALGVDNGPASMEFYSGGQLFRGKRQYELTNHLGNVLVVISDKKIGVSSGGSLNDYYNPDMQAGNDYYPFGMVARIANQGIPYTRFGFNGKEFDWEAKGWMNQYDYGFRIYDPRIGRFLSTDPLTREYPWYTPYQFAGNKPILFVDIDGLEEGDVSVEKFWENQPQIDMDKAPVKGRNAAGVPRNGVWAAKQQYALKSEMFSTLNYNRVFVENVMPIADEQWIKYNPEAAPYKDQKLLHHHIDGKNMAVLIPTGQNRDYFGKLHAYLKKNVSGTKIKGMLGGTLSVLGTLSSFDFNKPDSWINMFSGGEQAEDYIGKIKYDFGSGISVEINEVVLEHSPVLENGKQVLNKDGTPKTYVSKRTITGTLYSGYVWDEDSGEYRGINKIETRTEVWEYDRKGNRKTPDNKL